MHVMPISVLKFSVYPNCPGSRKPENNPAWLRPAIRVGVMEFKGTKHHALWDEPGWSFVAGWTYFAQLSSALGKKSVLIHGHVPFTCLFGKYSADEFAERILVKEEWRDRQTPNRQILEFEPETSSEVTLATTSWSYGWRGKERCCPEAESVSCLIWDNQPQGSC